MSSNPNAGSNATTTESIWDDVRPLGGVIYGAVAFVVGYIISSILFVLRYEDLNDDVFEVLGWIFYNAHTIDVTMDYGTETETINYLQELEMSDPGHFKFIPAVVLLIAGYVLASRVSERLSKKRAAIAGASVAIGYLALLVAGTFLFELEESGITAGPALGSSLVTIGVLYAVICGGIGGYLAGD